MNKAKVKSKREKEKQKRLFELQRLEENAKRLKSLTAGFGRSARSKEVEASFNESKIPSYVRSTVTNARPIDERFPKVEVKTKANLSEDMLLREEKAKQRTREIQKRVDIGYNKGGLMLLSEGEFEAMKKGELRRRS